MTNETKVKESANDVAWSYFEKHSMDGAQKIKGNFGQYPDERLDEICAAIAENYTRSQSSEWIPVETRLPEDSELYLVMVERVDEQPLRDIGWYDDRGWHTRSHLTTVTHWMLLPSAPKEKANG